jgi:Glycosyltransferase family 10 (fucosyltransferase) C-term
VNFCRYAGQHAPELVHVMGRQNHHNLPNYKGAMIDDSKGNHIPHYKYYIACENNSEYNYATEKVFEPIICESLPFYWGCPNLADHLDPDSFVEIPIDDPPRALEII